jgi:hypothetical protein
MFFTRSSELYILPCLHPNNVIIDSIQVDVKLENNKKCKILYEMNHHFQNVWATKLPWLELMGRCKVKWLIFNK